MSALPAQVSALIDEFNVVVDGGPGAPRFEVFARLRREMPVFRSERLDAWVVTQYDDVKTVLTDEDRFQPPREGAGASAFGRTFMQMSGREHSKKIGIVGREMRSPRALRERLESVVVQIAKAQAGSLTFGEPIDLRERYTMWVPLYTITELTQLPGAARFREWYSSITAGSSQSIANPGAKAAAFKAREEVRLFLEPIIEERQRNPGNDLLSDLATAEYDGKPIPHEEIVSNIIFLLAAGVETTERVLTNTLRHLAVHPAEWTWLRAHYTDPDALTAFCAEALRFYSPNGVLVRTAQVDTRIQDVGIVAGDRVCAVIGSGNRDDSRFPDGWRFDHNRFAGSGERQFTPGGDILTFGKGIHHCVGSRLAQLEMTCALTELLNRVERIEPAGILPESVGFFLHSPPTSAFPAWRVRPIIITASRKIRSTTGS